MLRRATRITRAFGLARPSYRVRLYSDSYSSSNELNQDSNQEGGSFQSRSGEFRQQNVANTVHFSGLPLSATREKLSEALAAAGLSGMTRVNVPNSTLTHGSRGYAFVTFDSAESAAAARSASVNFEGSPLRISNARTREESQKLKVYVGDLDYNLQDAALKSAVEAAFGPVEYASVATHRGLSKGFGFANFKSAEDADKARAVGKLMIDGKPARIESVRDREPRGPRDGGRDSYGSDRRGGDSYGSEGGYSRGGDRGYNSRGGDRGYNSRGGDSYGSSSRGSSRGGDSYGSSSRGSRGDNDSFGSDSYGSNSYGSDRGYGSSRGSDSYGSSSRGGYGSSSSTGSSSY